MAEFTAQSVVKEFETPSEPLRVLDGVSLNLSRGDNVAIVGDSGSGKSTFLHIAGTLDNATSGTVKLLDQDLSQIAPNQIADFRNKNIGFVFQEHHLLPQLSAIENVLIPVLANGSTTPESAARARLLLERVGLGERINHRPAKLSGGERQRVAVARALIRQPVLILADEPTGSLDPVNADKIGQLLLNLQKEDNAILICVTHSQKLADQFQQTKRLEKGVLVGS